MIWCKLCQRWIDLTELESSKLGACCPRCGNTIEEPMHTSQH